MPSLSELWAVDVLLPSSALPQAKLLATLHIWRKVVSRIRHGDEFEGDAPRLSRPRPEDDMEARDCRDCCRAVPPEAPEARAGPIIDVADHR